MRDIRSTRTGGGQRQRPKPVRTPEKIRAKEHYITFVDWTENQELVVVWTLRDQKHSTIGLCSAGADGTSWTCVEVSVGQSANRCPLDGLRNYSPVGNNLGLIELLRLGHQLILNVSILPRWTLLSHDYFVLMDLLFARLLNNFIIINFVHQQVKLRNYLELKHTSHSVVQGDYIKLAGEEEQTARTTSANDISTPPASEYFLCGQVPQSGERTYYQLYSLDINVSDQAGHIYVICKIIVCDNGKMRYVPKVIDTFDN